MPGALSASGMDDVVTARAHYGRLDEAGSPARIRLNSTAVRVRHLAPLERAGEVEGVQRPARYLSSCVVALVAIAISGLTLLWTIIWSISQRRLATRPRLTVRSAWAFLTSGPDAGPLCIQTTATNTGLAPVTVDSSTLLVRGQRDSRVAPLEWVFQSGPLPMRLEPGDRWMGMAHAESVKRTLDHQLGAREHWSVRPIVGDSTGRGHKATAAGWRRLLRRRWMTL